MNYEINVALDKYRSDVLSELPPSIQGEYGTGRLWRACKTAKELGLTPDDAIAQIIAHFNPRCEPPWTEREIAASVLRAYQCNSPNPYGGNRPSEIDILLRDQVVRNTDISLSELEQWFPAPDGQIDPFWYLGQLFGPGDPLLCLGRNVRTFITEPLSWWRERIDGVQFVVPNPMTAKMGLPQQGHKYSPRTLNNTGPRHYLVVEFDLVERMKDGRPSRDAALIREMNRQGKSVLDINASLLAHLSTKAPLGMIVHSGGKSLHGWFPVRNVSQDVTHRFFSYACRLGADRSLWSPCHSVRLPFGVREDNGQTQSVIYFNPETL